MKMRKPKAQPRILLLAVLLVGAIAVPGAQAIDLNSKVSGFLSTSNNLLSILLGTITGFVAPGGGGGSGFALTVYKSGTGSGTVTGLGINCGTDCYQDYGDFTSVQLTATPNSGHTFTGWSGACTGTGSCTVTLGGTNKAVTASFSAPGQTFSLSVTKNPTAGGTVTGPGISCGQDCFESYAGGTSVTLNPFASAGYVFTSWSGCNSVSGNTCSVTMDVSKTVTANFAPVYALSVAISGGVGGSVISSNVAGINCPTDCSENYISGTSVTLAQSAHAGYAFGGWSGACTGTGTCTVSMTAAKSVTATFNPTPTTYTATVTKTGNGSGQVSSVPAGISCPTDCSEAFPANTQAELTAYPEANSKFVSFSGACATTETSCTLFMTANRAVTANFIIKNHPLTVVVSGNGVISDQNLNYIICPTDCSENFVYGTPVTLQVFSMGPNTVFAGWGGACSGTATSCSLTMNDAKTVTATFSPTGTLTVTKIGSGSGTITSSPAGINCGADCSEQYTGGPTVTLTAAPDANSFLKTWQGCDSFSGNSCTVAVSSARAVTATFELSTFQLTVNKVGQGVVTSNDTKISCGQTCSAVYNTGASLTLSGTAIPGYIFQGQWTGCSSQSGLNCLVTMNSAKTITGTFSQGHILTVLKNIDTGGTVTGTRINCGVNCSATYLPQLSTDLTAVASQGYTFKSWTGCNAVVGAKCTVGMDGNKTVTVNFEQPSVKQVYQLSLLKSGNGTGVVTRDIAENGSCGQDCFKYEEGTSLTLTANADSNSKFDGWVGGVCSGTSTICTINMIGRETSKTVTATFTLKPACPGPIKITITPATVKPGAPFQIIVSGLCEGKFARRLPPVKISD